MKKVEKDRIERRTEQKTEEWKKIAGKTHNPIEERILGRMYKKRTEGCGEEIKMKEE